MKRIMLMNLVAWSIAAFIAIAAEELLSGPKSDAVCYESRGEHVVPEYELEGALVRVHLYDTVAEVQAAVGDSTGEAFAAYEVLPELNVSRCEIWAARPRYVLGDPNMDSLGHELMHCIGGAFHE